MLLLDIYRKRGENLRKIALIPAYCPDSRMIGLVKDLHERSFSIVVIDDGSGKKYDAVFEAAGEYADVQRYAVNHGKGEALKYGLSYIQNQYTGPYTIVTADADGQHRVEDIVRVSDASAEHPDSLILGKRVLDPSTPIKSRLGNGITRVMYRLTTGRNIYETQTGLRAFSHKFITRFLNLPGHRYEYEIDMILDASNVDIIEVTIRTVYFNNNEGSHFRPFQDTVSLNKEFFRYKLPSLIAGAAGFLLFVFFATITGSWLLPCIAARMFTILLKFILDKAIPFSEKPPIGRYAITSLIVLLCEIAVMGGLTALGVNPIIAKLLSCVLMIVVEIIVRKIFMYIQFH